MQISEARSAEDRLNKGVHDAKTRLLNEFRDQVGSDVVEKTVHETFESMKDSSVSEFVPLFVYRSAKEQLFNLSRSVSA